MHDSLGRLLYAKQPEQDANSNFVATDPITNNSQWSVKYLYDDNGNITTTTDARNDSITATYDSLNRLKVRDYSDPNTPDVSFYYDGKYLISTTRFKPQPVALTVRLQVLNRRFQKQTTPASIISAGF